MLEKSWPVWLVIAIGYVINPVWWSAAYNNCFLAECYWVKPIQVIFSIVALILAIIWWRKTESATRGSFASFANSAVFLAIFHMFLNGLGLIGPDACPAIDLNCR